MRFSRELSKPRQLHPFYKHFLFNREHRFIYCYVPKVACSSLKRWFLQIAGVPLAEARPTIHPYVERRFSLAALPRQEARRLLHDDTVFRFAVVRNPFSRLVSAYLNKIVRPEGPGMGVIKADQKGRLWQPGKRLRYEWRKFRTGRGYQAEIGLSFREFLSYIARRKPAKLNAHWRPQTLILGNVRFHALLPLEQMDVGFARVCARLGLPAGLEMVNRTRRKAKSNDANCYTDWSTAELRTLGAAPRYELFYDEETRRLAAKLYDEDIALCERISAEGACNNRSFGDQVAA